MKKRKKPFTFGDDRPHKAPEPHQCVPGTLMAFTLNPSENYDRLRVNYKERVRKCQIDLIKTFELSDISFYMYPEVSSNGRIHFHGFIKCPADILHLYLVDLERFKPFYTYELKNILEGISNKYKTWFDYCTKQSHLYKDIKPYSLHKGITLEDITPPNSDNDTA